LVKDIPEPVEIQGLLDYLDNLDQWRNQNWREIFHDVQHHFA
jgi:hypothetical protein